MWLEVMKYGTKKTPCDNCSKVKWLVTEAGNQAGTVFPFDDHSDILEREVYFDSWNGEDIFYLDQPGVPIITQHFLDLIQ